MDCSRFEEQISEYLDGTMSKGDGTIFREHALQCRACRCLLDEVKGALHECKMDDALDMSPALESALMTIACEHAEFACQVFQELITEFLDGFVPAPVYHRFEEHAEGCSICSTLLTDVVYAVAACHSVHTYEEVEIPDALLFILDRIAIPQLRKNSLAQRISAFAGSLIPRPRPNRRLTFATASSLVFATFAFLLFGFSDDRTVAGIYRQAQLKFGQIYSQGADIYSRKDELAARIERVGYGIGEIWDSLGGDKKSDDRIDKDQSKRNRDQVKRPDADEKN